MRPAAVAAIALVAGAWGAPVRAQAGAPPRGALARVDFEQRLGERVPLDLRFRDETGASVRLGDYFGRRPVVLSLVYFGCPMLCGEVLRAEARGLADLPFDAGREFEAVTVSFDPADTPEEAARRKALYLAGYGHPGAGAGWHFLTGDEAAIRELTSAVGFRYARDEATGQFAHAAGIVILTPDGRLARYLLGVDYPATALRLGLVEASRGAIGGPVDRLILYCAHYDPSVGRYGIVIANVVRLLGAGTAAALVLLLAGLALVERHRRARKPGPASG